MFFIGIREPKYMNQQYLSLKYRNNLSKKREFFIWNQWLTLVWKQWLTLSRNIQLQPDFKI